MNDTGIIILAAGSSSRLGRPKQNLSYQGRSLIQHITDEANNARLHPVVIITGASVFLVSSDLTEYKVELVYNEHWQKGMGSGIAAGMDKIRQLNADLNQVIIAVCDQPFISAKLFTQLVEMKDKTGKGIIACTYADAIGTPVLFGKQYFYELQQLDGEEGAKRLIKQYLHDVESISFPQGNIDIDTEEDYKNLMNGQQ